MCMSTIYRASMQAKTDQLQIRVTPQQKAALKRMASMAGCDVSTYVLNRMPLAGGDRFEQILQALRGAAQPSYPLAELNDFLSASARAEFAGAVASADLRGLTPYLSNYVAAMVEQAAYMKRLAPPKWTATIAPLDAPRFATPMKSLRAHLLLSAPVPFKRRNIFVDSSIGARV